MLYEDKTEVLLKCFFNVQNEVGLGRREEAYHNACKLWLDAEGVPYKSKAPHPLYLSGKLAQTLVPDLVFWDSITVELKAVPRALEDPEFVQIFDYLKCRGDRLGFLVNMGLDRVEHERLIYDPPQCTLTENWEYWEGRIEGRDRELGIEVREAVRAIFDQHGAGYGAEVIEKLLLCELARRGLRLVVSPTSKAFFRGVEVDESRLDCLVIEDRLLLTVAALFDTNDFSINRGTSFLSALGLTWGVAANFGKKGVELNGLRSSR